MVWINGVVMVVVCACSCVWPVVVVGCVVHDIYVVVGCFGSVRYGRKDRLLLC